MRTVAQRYGKIFVVAVIVLAGACTSGLIVAWTRADSEIPQDTSSDYPDAGSGAGDHYDANSNVPLPNLSSSVPSRNITEVVAARDFDHRLWRLEKEIEIADPGTGRKKIERLVSKIVEVGCGICYRDAAGSWQATDTTWRQTRDGFFMNTANYQVVIGKTAGSWLNYTVDESVMQLRPAALKADDGVYLEDIATLVPDIKGVIDPNDPSRLVFAGAFGTRIDLELQLKPDGFHQNVIFHDEPNLPSYFDENVTDIRLYTELNLDDYVQNQNVAIVIGNQELIGPQPQLNTKPVLDHIEFVKVVEEYDKLVGYDRHQFVDSRVFDSGGGAEQKRTVAYKQLFRDEKNKTYLIETLAQNFFKGADYPVTWDYVTRNGSLEEDEDWYADATYYISGNLTLSNGTTLCIEPGTIIKIRPRSKLDARNGTLIARGEPYSYIIFTSRDDDTHGEILPNSTHNPFWGEESLMVNPGSTLQFCKIAYRFYGIDLSGGESGPALQNNIICNCRGAVRLNSSGGSHKVFNNLIYDCPDFGIRVDTADGDIEIGGNTIDNCSKGIDMQDDGTGGDVIKNNLITNCATAGISATAWSGITHNGYYGCTSGKLGSEKVDLSESPYDLNNTYLGSCFLNKNPNGGAALIDAGDDQVEVYYDDPNLWSVHHVRGADRVFTSSTTLNEDTFWVPNDASLDTGTVAIGYHHPRVDYLLRNNVTVSSGTTLTVKPGTVIAMGGSTSRSGDLEVNGKLLCAGDPFGEDYIRFMQYNLATADWDGLQYWDPDSALIYLNNGSDPESCINFTRISGLYNGIFIRQLQDNPVHDVIFRWNTYGLFTVGFDSGNNQIRNNIFVENNVGWCNENRGSGSYTIENNTFDRNISRAAEVGLNDGSYIIIKNCVFSNTGIDNGGNPTGCAIYEYGSGTTTFSESYNAFYANGNHYYSENSGVMSLDVTDFAGIPDAGDPSKVITTGDFYQDGQNFADRFYLPQTSKLVDAGYDPNTGGTCGYTTNINGSADAGPVDIGYHYPVPGDTDGDGLLDYQEYWLGTRHDNYDGDYDGLLDGEGGLISIAAYSYGIDKDGDGWVDGENDAGTDPTKTDSDGDNIPDGWEYLNGLNPLQDDAGDDREPDNLSNLQEYQLGTNPNDEDTDDDHMPDGWEYSHLLDPLRNDADEDFDHDGLTNLWEYLHGFEPDNAADADSDLDQDGFSNIIEYVHGSDHNNPNSLPQPKTMVVPAEVNSIQQAINWSIFHDIVEVEPGTYYEHIDFKGKTITVRSTDPNDADVVAATIIDGGGNPSDPNTHGPVVTFATAEDPNSVLAGFTITGGYATNGGGIYCYYYYSTPSSPTIRNCIILQNEATSLGGGMYNYYSSPKVINCVIRDNQAATGGGIYNYFSSSPELSNCNIQANEVSGNGAGMFNTSWSSPIVKNCIFAGNVSDGNGGGTWNGANSSPIISNCTFSGNSAAKGGGMFSYTTNARPTVTNCIFWGNSATTSGGEVHNLLAEPNFRYCDIEGGLNSDKCSGKNSIDGGGNINSDPLFADPDDYDFHLEPDSPCINAGAIDGNYGPQNDIDGESRLQAGRVDIGADEARRVHNLSRHSWYATVQQAIDDAQAAEMIMVYPGVYGENLNFRGKAIILSSIDPNNWRITQQTTIKASDAAAPVLTFNSGEDGDSQVKGLTFTAGYYGILCHNYSHPKITGCIISANVSHGVRCVSGEPAILGNKIFANGGCGVASLSLAPPKIVNNWIYDNTTGVQLEQANSPAELRNNTIVNNSAAGINVISGETASISNCILWDNEDDLANCQASYSCIKQQDAGPGNIYGDPLFINSAKDNYHIGAHSPCVDAGDLSGSYETETDIYGQDRFIGAAVDMGASELHLVRVDINADDPNNTNTGNSWHSAVPNLQRALNLVKHGEIWVADGAYVPGPQRDDSFHLKNDVRLYGGFIGITDDPNSDPNSRTAQTILSGDIGHVGDPNDNCYHVVKAVTVDETALLDGITITEGNADGPSGGDTPPDAGGGLLLLWASPVITNCIFYENAAINGAGMFNKNGSATIENCVFYQNRASQSGGAISNDHGASKITNCTFYGNEAVYGGGIANQNASSSHLINSILWNDLSQQDGPEIYSADATVFIRCCNIKGGGGSGTNWDTGLGIDEGGNIAQDPCFVDALEPAGIDGRFGSLRRHTLPL